jgi:2',3'-cyclic-nucleotide 2'-phosphodiesterase (5'-nucleotidase family)
MRVEAGAPAGNRVRDVRINGQPLDEMHSYTVAIPDFLLAGGDGYTMFRGGKILVGPEAGNLMVSSLEKYVAAKGDVAPELDGRITIVR